MPLIPRRTLFSRWTAAARTSPKAWAVGLRSLRRSWARLTARLSDRTIADHLERVVDEAVTGRRGSGTP